MIWVFAVSISHKPLCSKQDHFLILIFVLFFFSFVEEILYSSLLKDHNYIGNELLLQNTGCLKLQE